MKIGFKSVLFGVFLSCASGVVVDSSSKINENVELLKTDQFSIVKDRIFDLRKSLDSSEILVVFDLDNTVFTMSTNSKKNDGFIGGDAWFNFEASQLKTSQTKLGSFRNLLRAQGYFFSTKKMELCETSIPKIVTEIQTQNIPLFALTSRGSLFTDATLRDLLHLGVQFHNTAPKLSQFENEEVFMPFDAKNVAQYGFSEEEILKYKLLKPRAVTYFGGVYFSAGQHKGAFLKILLSQMNLSPKAIVFLDDSEKNIKSIKEAFNGSRIKVYAYLYEKMNNRVKDFNGANSSLVLETLKKTYAPFWIQ